MSQVAGGARSAIERARWARIRQAALQKFRAALVEVAGRPVLAVAGSADPEAVRGETGIADVRFVDEVPVDARHRAKVDRQALVALLAEGAG